MRTTLALDDKLVAEAQELTGLKEKSSLIREALTALIQRESARRLARLGGSEPDLEVPPRRRPVSTHDEVIYLIERNKLFGRGIGYIDLHLRAAVRLTPGATFWTADKRLHAISAQLGLAAT